MDRLNAGGWKLLRAVVLLKEDSTGRPFRWADLSTPDLGAGYFLSRFLLPTTALRTSASTVSIAAAG
jgi:hypothetical protein